MRETSARARRGLMAEPHRCSSPSQGTGELEDIVSRSTTHAQLSFVSESLECSAKHVLDLITTDTPPVWRNQLERLHAQIMVQAATVESLLAAREAGKTTHPFYWGAFAAFGDWR